MAISHNDIYSALSFLYIPAYSFSTSKYIFYFLFSKWLTIHSEVIDFGRSRGIPNALSHKTCERAPMARLTPKRTVKYSY
mmetsp:Transcript_47956/g.61492  ORF Transcript_47956/g.61492 Transcript_47956/m.61492 type:complete len:80 (+) Transcript_47956:106-345(+)